jgi:hypothetical protein
MGTPLTNSLLLVKEATPSVDSTNKPPSEVDEEWERLRCGLAGGCSGPWRPLELMKSSRRLQEEEALNFERTHGIIFPPPPTCGMHTKTKVCGR